MEAIKYVWSCADVCLNPDTIESKRKDGQNNPLWWVKVAERGNNWFNGYKVSAVWPPIGANVPCQSIFKPFKSREDALADAFKRVLKLSAGLCASARVEIQTAIHELKINVEL